LQKVAVCNDCSKRSFRNENDETMKRICAHLCLHITGGGGSSLTNHQRACRYRVHNGGKPALRETAVSSHRVKF
jgi:hypothetical protein